ncbi:helix-turn-helix domain-containing protein [Streptomyces decoyicus]
MAERPHRPESATRSCAGGAGARAVVEREDERIHIAGRLREKASVRAITAELGRSPSTISREIRRSVRSRW